MHLQKLMEDEAESWKTLIVEESKDLMELLTRLDCDIV